MTPAPFQTAAVLGAGSWGTALAVWLAGRGLRVTLWGHDPGHVRRLRDTRVNARYLPGVALPEGVRPVENLADAAGADLVVVVTPSHALSAGPGAHARWLLGRVGGGRWLIGTFRSRSARRLPVSTMRPASFCGRCSR